MTVNYPDSYSVARGIDGAIRLRQTITASAIKRILENQHHLATSLCPRVIAQWGGNDGQELDDAAASYVTLFEAYYTPSVGRETTLTCALHGDNLGIRVSVYDDTLATLHGQITTSVGVAGDITTPLTLSTTSAKMVVRVEYKTSGASALLRAVSIYEAPAADADDATGFKPVDDSALAADRALASVLGFRAVDNIRALVDLRNRGYAHAWSQKHPTIVHGITKNGDQPQALVIPFLIPVGKYDTEITWTMRANWAVRDVTVGVEVKPAQSGGASTGPDSSLTITSGSDEEVTIGTLDVTPYQGTTALVLVSFVSDHLSTPEILQDGITSNEFEFGTYDAGAAIHVDGRGDWDNTDPFVEDVRPYWAQIVYGTLGGATHDPNLHPAPFFAIRHHDTAVSTDSRIYAWPPFRDLGDGVAVPSTGGKVATDYWIHRYPMGYLELSSLAWHVSDVQAPSDFGTAFEAGSATSARLMRQIQRLNDELFLNQTPVFACGPPLDLATDEPATTTYYQPANPCGGTRGEFPVPYSSAFEELASCHVGDNAAYSGEGANAYRSSYIVEAIVAISTRTVMPTTVGAIGASFKLRLSGSGVSAVESDVLHVDFTAADSSARVPGEAIGDWLRWEPIQGEGYTVGDPLSRAHAGVGMVPQHLWHTLPWQRVVIEIDDTEGSEPRLMELLGLHDQYLPDGPGATHHHPTIHVLSWLVYGAPAAMVDLPAPPAAAPPATPSFSNWTGSRRALATMTASAGITAYGNVTNLIDGAFGENATDGHVAGQWTNSPLSYFQIDMGAAVVCDGIRIYTGDNVGWGSAGTYTQKAVIKASNDATFATGVVTLATGVEIADGGHVTTGTYLTEADTTVGSNWRRTYGWTTPATAYRYYRLERESGSGIVYWYTTEFEFSVDV